MFLPVFLPDTLRKFRNNEFTRFTYENLTKKFDNFQFLQTENDYCFFVCVNCLFYMICE